MPYRRQDGEARSREPAHSNVSAFHASFSALADQSRWRLPRSSVWRLRKLAHGSGVETVSKEKKQALMQRRALHRNQHDDEGDDDVRPQTTREAAWDLTQNMQEYREGPMKEAPKEELERRPLVAIILAHHIPRLTRRGDCRIRGLPKSRSKVHFDALSGLPNLTTLVGCVALAIRFWSLDSSSNHLRFWRFRI